MSECKHCWHETGTGTSHFTGGSDAVVCCRCGACGDREWHIERRRKKGHGPHYTENWKVPGDVEVRKAIVGATSSTETWVHW